MKKKTVQIALRLLLSVLFICSLASCEKHDGVYYFSSKCNAKLNGQTYIDQTRVNISGARNTPYLYAKEYEMEYASKLRLTRDSDPSYFVEIFLYVNTPWEYLTEPQRFECADADVLNEGLEKWNYTKYCRENKISYATILRCIGLETEIVREGTFQITSYDMEQKTYSGKFSLQFSEGTMTGEFTTR